MQARAFGARRSRARAAVSARCSCSRRSRTCRRRHWEFALRRRRLDKGPRRVTGAQKGGHVRMRSASRSGAVPRRSSATPLVKPPAAGRHDRRARCEPGSASAESRERGAHPVRFMGLAIKRKGLEIVRKGRPLGAAVEAQVEVGSTFLTECRKPPPASTSDDASRCQRSAPSPGRGSRTPRRKKSAARGGICSGMGPLRNVEAHEAEVCTDASAGAPVTNLSGVFSS
jgi:hypothetical protein